ncbi:MAG TPA: hypothetical protein VGM41_16520 [Chitinophagaceae bacterium]|jgi:hypothetical protein
MKNTFRSLLWTLFAIIALNACKKSSSSPASNPPAIKNNLVYIYKTDSTDGVAFKSLLQLNGCSVALLDKSAAAAFNYTTYNMIIIGGNTDAVTLHDNWDTVTATVIKNSGKPCLLLNEGGLLFADAIKNTVGWGGCGESSLASFIVLQPNSSLYKQPKLISIPADSVLTIYSTPQNVESLYVNAPPMANVNLVGREGDTPSSKYYPITIEAAKYAVFGYYGNTNSMTATGKDFLVNLIYYVGNLAE